MLFIHYDVVIMLIRFVIYVIIFIIYVFFKIEKFSEWL
jgi:hypothetical protein